MMVFGRRCGVCVLQPPFVIEPAAGARRRTSVAADSANAGTHGARRGGAEGRKAGEL